MTLRTISSGVVSSGLTVSGGDELLVLSGGTASATTILSGGTERLSAGARAEGATVSAGAALIGPGRATDVVDFGLVSGVTISGEFDIESGGVASADSGSVEEFVHSGGLVIGEVISGFEDISGGGNVSGASIQSGGFLLEEFGAVMSGVQVKPGAIANVAGAATGVVISSGGSEVFVTGAHMVDDSVMSGGTLIFNADIMDGETLTIGASVASQFVLQGVTLDRGALLELEGAKILSGATVSLTAAAAADFVSVEAGGVLIGAGTIENMGDAGLVSGVLLNSFGELDVTKGGVASRVRIASGAVEWVSSGALSIGDVISNGGIEIVNPGAVTSGDTIDSGGTLEFAGSIDADQSITFGASFTRVTVFEGEKLSSGAHLQLDGATILSGATVSLLSDASPVTLTVESGGVLRGPGEVNSAQVLGLVSGVTVSNGRLVVSSGGVARGDAFLRDGDETVRGGETIGETIHASGSEQVNRGLASGTIVSQGGVLLILDGSASGTRIHGGIETIAKAGQTSGTVISGGYEFDYGLAVGTLVRSGGHAAVGRGGVASGSVIDSGGREGVDSGGEVVDATLSGGTLMVSSGGTISGGVAIHAGRAIVSGAMAAGQTVSFTGVAGVLELDNLAGFQAAISGLSTANQKIDLGGFAYGGGETLSWTQSGTSGTLTVQDGAKRANLTLIGTYAASSFHLANDGHGGTAVRGTAPPAAAPAATQFAQAAASLEGGRAAAGVAAIHADGNAPIGASPLAGAATSGR